MTVLKATQDQYNALDGWINFNHTNRLEFVKDGLDNWIISKDNLHNPEFAPILDQLLELEEIEYVQPIRGEIE